MPAAQSQKEAVVNEALSLIDTLVHPVIQSEQNDPPATPTEGESWLVGGAPTGDWSANSGDIAVYSAGDWLFLTQFSGLQCWHLAHQQFVHFDDGWKRAIAPAEPSGGSTVDSESRQAIVDLIEALRDAGILAAS